MNRQELRPLRYLAGVATVLGAVYLLHAHLLLTFNQTPSVPWHCLLVLKGQAVGRGDIAVFSWHGDRHFVRGTLFNKFVAGVAGDRIETRGREVWVAGQHIGLAKPFSRMGEPLQMIAPGVIPAGRYFMKGTHFDSFDSRYQMYGLIGTEELIGRGYVVY